MTDVNNETEEEYPEKIITIVCISSVALNQIKISDKT